jgi:hypothetical protein
MALGNSSTGSVALAADHHRMAAELKHLSNLDLHSLQVRWRRIFGRPAPRHLSRALILRVISYKVQADVFGDLDKATVRLLDQIAHRAASARAKGEKKSEASVPPVEETRRLKPGTVLVREHGNELQRVAVRAEGYEWKGQSFNSLSEVARAITGVRWNGPRFFGLRSSGKGRAASPEKVQR